MQTFCYELGLFEFKIATATSQKEGMDWAGFEPATSRLRSEHYYQTELPALRFYAK